MKASIITRVYNGEKTIGKAIRSVLDQDFPKEEFEYIIVNDGSTDDTRELLREYEGNPRITIHDQENQGGIVAANKGFELAKGEYVVLLDADDYFEPGLLKELTVVLDENPELDFVYSDYYEETDENREVVSPKNLFETLSAGTMFRKRKLLAEGGYKVGVDFAEYDLMLRTINKWKGRRYPKPLYNYVRSESSNSANKDFIEKAGEQLKQLHPDQLDSILLIRDY